MIQGLGRRRQCGGKGAAGAGAVEILAPCSKKDEDVAIYLFIKTCEF